MLLVQLSFGSWVPRVLVQSPAGPCAKHSLPAGGSRRWQQRRLHLLHPARPPGHRGWAVLWRVDAGLHEPGRQGKPTVTARPKVTGEYRSPSCNLCTGCCYLASLCKQSCSCYPVHPSLTRIVHLLHFSLSLEAFWGGNVTIFLHCLGQQAPDKSPGFEMLSQHQVLLITIVNNGSETQDCWVLFLALHPPSCVNLDSISLLWETSSSTTAEVRLEQGFMNGSPILWHELLQRCKVTWMNNRMFNKKTTLIILISEERNVE